MLGAGERMYPYFFEGYWRDVGTIDSFWDANMDILSTKLLDLYDPVWPIRSRSPRNIPEFIGDSASVTHSIVTEGCEIYGEVSNSVLSGSVLVEPGASVRYSILMPGAKVCAGAKVEYAIIGENTVVGANATVGTPPDGSDGWGIATCGPNINVPDGACVAPGAMVYDSQEVAQ